MTSRLTVVRTLLTYLELLGYTESGTPFYATYQFKPLVTSAEMLRRFDGERRDFLTRLLAQSRKAKIWFEVDLDQAARRNRRNERPRGTSARLPSGTRAYGTEDRRHTPTLSCQTPAGKSTNAYPIHCTSD